MKLILCGEAYVYNTNSMWEAQAYETNSMWGGLGL